MLLFKCRSSFSDCKIISKNGVGQRIFEVGTTATLQWNLNGVSNGLTAYQVFYYNNKNKIQILSATPAKNNLDRSMNYVPNNNPFEENRINGHLKLSNGNGKLTFTLSNIQYDESGVFSFDFTPATEIINKASVNLTLDVQGVLLKIIGLSFSID